MFKKVPAPLNNLDKLHILEMWVRWDENWGTKHVKWINLWNNLSELMFSGHPTQWPLFHARLYEMIYGLFYIFLVNVITTARSTNTTKSIAEPTFLTTSNYNDPHDEPYWHSFVTEQFMMSTTQATKDSIIHLFPSCSFDFFFL